MKTNIKLSALLIVLTVACGKKLGKENTNNLSNLEPSEVKLNPDTPLPSEDNLSSNKDEVNNLIMGVDYSNRCADEGVTCDGLWALKQSRCNDEPVSGAFANEPVFINIKKDVAELQFENGSVDSVNIKFDENGSDSMTFSKEDKAVSQKSYSVATEEGIMNIHLSGSDSKCPNGIRKAVYTRLSSDAIASLFKKADEIAAAKKEEEECIAAGKAAEDDAACDTGLLVEASK